MLEAILWLVCEALSWAVDLLTWGRYYQKKQPHVEWGDAGFKDEQPPAARC